MLARKDQIVQIKCCGTDEGVGIKAQLIFNVKSSFPPPQFLPSVGGVHCAARPCLSVSGCGGPVQASLTPASHKAAALLLAGSGPGLDRWPEYVQHNSMWHHLSSCCTSHTQPAFTTKWVDNMLFFEKGL